MNKHQSHTEREEWILAVRAGDQAAFDRLLSAYEPLIGAEVARHLGGLSPEDAKDLRQVATVAFYRAALGYDLSQNEVEFGLYAKICIANALSSQLRVMHRHMAEISVPHEVQSESAFFEDPARRVMEEEAAEALYARIRSLLSPFENRVWSLYVSGRRSGEIARLLRKEPHSIENAVYRIRRKLRAALGGRQ